MKNNWKWIVFTFILLTLVVVGFIIIVSPLIKINKIKSCSDFPTRVDRVIDGDTFELCSGEKVRLLCVDTPERGKPGYEDAKLFLEDLILNREVYINTSNYDVETIDKYGRLLAWVYIENDLGEKILVNKYLLEEGYGDILIIPPETCNEVAD
ncbi:MAG: hypothetical protein BWY36_00666 [Candidatus Diapherotrites archaeon ADurb.Bin253]|jgi:micrococcal nuclease|nr:MAG: hypothetical protein BWY36_00666 [Candidatus Diapherotrites archaeon ADurb.Bin253]HNZ52326.1 thermonuclease family protein [Candidatus Pacearchaeota archaeon]HOF44498.1 thermonuclease family protein [Candidatus Pacearchaeota archaeon]HOH04402.1 thermonuclease family protein [Candidatus Pacearchaeota archaeon]